MNNSTKSNDVVTMLANRVQSANAALALGDFDGYLANMRPASNCVLMGPFGGVLTQGYDVSAEGRARMSKQFKAGTVTQELISSYSTQDMVMLVTVERIEGEIGGLPRQPWVLRVTQIFHFTSGDWVLVHRHADPMAKRVSLEQGAALAKA